MEGFGSGLTKIREVAFEKPCLERCGEGTGKRQVWTLEKQLRNNWVSQVQRWGATVMERSWGWDGGHEGKMSEMSVA